MLKLNTLRNTLLVLIHPEIKVGSLNLGTLSRQAAYPTGCGLGDDLSHLAIRLVKEAFDTYSSMESRRDAIWRKFKEAKKNPRVLTMNDNLAYTYYTNGKECVYYMGWYSTIYY